MSPFDPPKLRDDLPRYPRVSQLIRVTAATVPGPAGVSQLAGSSVLAPPLYIAFVQQTRNDSLLPRDREPCLAQDVNAAGLTAGYYKGQLVNSFNSLPVFAVTEKIGTSGGTLRVLGRTGDIIGVTQLTLNNAVLTGTASNAVLTPDVATGNITPGGGVGPGPRQGIIDTAAQTIPGDKAFEGNFGVSATSGIGPGGSAYFRITSGGAAETDQNITVKAIGISTYESVGAITVPGSGSSWSGIETASSAALTGTTSVGGSVGVVRSDVLMEAIEPSGDYSQLILGMSHDAGTGLGTESLLLQGRTAASGELSYQFCYAIRDYATGTNKRGASGSLGASASFVGGICTDAGTGSIAAASGTLTNHAPIIGAGGSTLKATAAMTDGQMLVGQTGADPLPKTISGAFTLAATGVATLGNIDLGAW